MKLKLGNHYTVVPLKWEVYTEEIAASTLFAHFAIRKEDPVKDEWTLEISLGDDGPDDETFPSLFKAKKAAREYYIETVQGFVDQLLRR